MAGAEDALSDAFAAALAEWPGAGIPDNPRAWLASVARRKQIDQFRRRRVRRDASDHIALLAHELDEARSDAAAVPDERLGLMFVCAHPAIDPAVRAPLMLRAVMGLDTATIASAFLVAPATMGQRLVRARARVKLARIPFRVPDSHELHDRLNAVLDAIYAAFAAGWSDPAGTEVRRRDLATEAIWLGRLIVSLLARGARGVGSVGLDALCRGPTVRASWRPGRVCPPRRTRPGPMGSGDDRGSGEGAAPRRHDGRRRPLPVGGGDPIGACRAAPDRNSGLGGDRTTVRGVVHDVRFAGGDHQSGRRGRGDAKRRARTGPAGYRRRRRPRGGLSAGTGLPGRGCWHAPDTSPRPMPRIAARSDWNRTRRYARF